MLSNSSRIMHATSSKLSSILCLYFTRSLYFTLCLPLFDPLFSFSCSVVSYSQLAESACLIQFPLAIYCSIICSVSLLAHALPPSPSPSLFLPLYVYTNIINACLPFLLCLRSWQFPLHVLVKSNSLQLTNVKCKFN